MHPTVTIVRQDGCCTQAQKWSRSQVGASIFFGRINQMHHRNTFQHFQSSDQESATHYLKVSLQWTHQSYPPISNPKIFVSRNPHRSYHIKVACFIRPPQLIRCRADPIKSDSDLRVMALLKAKINKSISATIPPPKYICQLLKDV